MGVNKVGKFASGGTPSKDRNDFWVGDFPWVSPKDMKTPYISDALDHISEKVFEETNLKKMAAGHLLIVVRGMILAHTFPTAINTVPVSINQDMKAILPLEGLLVQYLKNCLDNMARQVLAIITTAGHGTKKFDTGVMMKVLIPIPPLPLQSQFAAIVTKVESLKSKYAQSLASLENLYGSLSQCAFKGELDLSKIPSNKIERNAQTKMPVVEPFKRIPRPKFSEQYKGNTPLLPLKIAAGGNNSGK
jgi:type I restriction enzyme S subunit